MLAVLKGPVVDYAIFEGVNYRYPVWFQEAIVDHTYVDEFGYAVYGLDSLVEGYDVFLRNLSGDICRTNVNDFERCFFRIKGAPMAINKCPFVEYIIFDGEPPINYPGWFLDEIEAGSLVRMYDNYYWYGADGEVCLDPTCVFIRNSEGEVRYIELDDFYEHFFMLL